MYIFICINYTSKLIRLKIAKINVFFDIDGVLLKECGISEKYYAHIMQIIETNQQPSKIDNNYSQKVNLVRQKIKGQHPILKVQHIREYINNPNCTYSNYDILKLQSQAQIQEIRNQFGNNYKNYWTCDIEQLKNELLKLKQQYDIQFNTLTANMRQNTDFLIEEVLNLQDLITDRLCYQMQEKPEYNNKSEMLDDYLKKNNLQNCINIVVGDGFNDMKAANDCKAIGIGVDGVQGGQYHVKSNELVEIVNIIKSYCEK